MRKALFFRLLALKLLVIPAVSNGCGGAVAAHEPFDAHGPFKAEYARQLLLRVESYARMMRSWELGNEAYVDRQKPLMVLRLGETGLGDNYEVVADKVEHDRPLRMTDATYAFLDEMNRVRTLNARHHRDNLDAFCGGSNFDRVTADQQYLHRFVQALLAARELQRYVLSIEAAGVKAIGETKPLNSLTPGEIERVRAEIASAKPLDTDSVTVNLLGNGVRVELPRMLSRLSRNNFHHGGSHSGFQQILLRYLALTRRLGVEDHPDLNNLLNLIDSARESASSAQRRELPFPWEEPTLHN